MSIQEINVQTGEVNVVELTAEVIAAKESFVQNETPIHYPQIPIGHTEKHGGTGETGVES